MLLVKADDVPNTQFGPVQRKGPLKAANVSVDWGSECESVWLQFGGVNAFNKLHFLNWCLVGRLLR